MIALNLSADNRILSACVVLPNGNYDGLPIVETIPDGNLPDYRFVNGKYVYDPLPRTSAVIVAPYNIVEGEYITIGGVLYKVIANIPVGEPIVEGHNAVATNIEEQLAELAKGE